MESWVNISGKGTATLPRDIWSRMGCPERLFVSIDPVCGLVYLRKNDDGKSEPRSLFSSEGNRSPQVALSGMIRKMGIEKVMAGHRHLTQDDDCLIIALCYLWEP